MRFYPGVSVQDLRECSQIELALLAHYMHVIRARERLEWITDQACAHSREEEAKEHRMELAKVAYRDNPTMLARALIYLNR